MSLQDIDNEYDIGLILKVYQITQKGVHFIFLINQFFMVFEEVK